MPISDAYVVQYLLQETLRHHAPLTWRERESDAFSANLHGIEVDLYTLRYRSGPRIYLTLSSFPERIDVSEPIKRGLFREKYDSEEDQHLAHLLRELTATVARQCAARVNRTAEAIENVREDIYRRLIGVESTQE